MSQLPGPISVSNLRRSNGNELPYNPYMAYLNSMSPQRDQVPSDADNASVHPQRIPLSHDTHNESERPQREQLPSGAQNGFVRAQGNRLSRNTYNETERPQRDQLPSDANSGFVRAQGNRLSRKTYNEPERPQREQLPSDAQRHRLSHTCNTYNEPEPPPIDQLPSDTNSGFVRAQGNRLSRNTYSESERPKRDQLPSDTNSGFVRAQGNRLSRNTYNEPDRPQREQLPSDAPNRFVRAQRNRLSHNTYNEPERPQMIQPSVSPIDVSALPQTDVQPFSSVIHEFRRKCSTSRPQPPPKPSSRNSSIGATVVGNVGSPGLPLPTSKLRPLPGYIELTTTEPDMLGIDDSPVCAKMPCGHVIGPESMAAYATDELRKGNYRFYCPGVSDSGKPCNIEWLRDHVRHVACYTAAEYQEFERKISENFLKRSEGKQTCPGCRTWCFRDPGTESRVLCPLCTKSQNGSEFVFCWLCLKSWKNGSSAGWCGNSGCHGKDNRLHILATCPTKQITCCNKCPSIRGCPKCGLLIEHKIACAHTLCSNCQGYGFCFICLKGKDNGCEWPCSYAGNCPLAPRQTNLPGLG